MSITGSNNPFACEPVVFANANTIVSLGTITRDGNQFTFSVGFVWKINGVTYQNTAPVVLTIAEASEGFQRIDNALLNTSNTIELQQGNESDTIALKPIAPDTNIILTSWNISGDTIGNTEEPIIGTQFKKKSENLDYSYPLLKGTRAVIQLRPEGNSYYAIGNTLLISVDGFGTSLITGNPDAETPYPMKDLFIHNTGTTPFTLLHNGTGSANSKFFFLDESDLVVPPGGKVWLKYGITYCQLFLTSWNNGIPTFQQVTDQGNVTDNEITAAAFKTTNGEELPTIEWVYDKFASKENSRQYNYSFSEPISSIRLDLPATESYLIIDTLIQSINGFNVSFNDLYDGKDYYIYNNSSDEISLKHNADNANYDFNFKKGVNIKLPRRGLLHLKFIGGKFIDVIQSWIDYNELQPYLDTKQDKAFSIKVTTPSSIVTGSVSEVEVLKVTIPPNSLSLNEIINMPLLILTKTGTAGTCEIRVKISTASTMPFGNTDAIARYSSGASNLFVKMQRDFIIDNGTIKVYPLSSNVIDNTTSASVILTKSFDPTVTNYLYVSIQQSATGDSSVLQGFYLTNQ
ncbi:MAG: hypothetical protein RSE15_00805 [Flavobacterium sp.]|uniref:hypothetical protein n=1 Tax=Flavobacterium sp. TaxID=239 RepID=UPI002B45E44A|nr:hypothetical protein [Flavobacterium sp.]WRH73387.1 MAG: hypothetical protein RSE15_00805 [Flavobacterium sp.]